MLVVTRKPNESIMIGDGIEVSVLSLLGGKVKIGITAPQDVPVFRREIYRELQQSAGQSRSEEGPAAPEVDAALGRLLDPASPGHVDRRPLSRAQR